MCIDASRVKSMVRQVRTERCASVGDVFAFLLIFSYLFAVCNIIFKVLRLKPSYTLDRCPTIELPPQPYWLHFLFMLHR